MIRSSGSSPLHGGSSVPTQVPRGGEKNQEEIRPGRAPAPKVAAAPRQLQTRWLVGVAALVLLGGLVLLYAIPQYSGHTTVVVLARDVKTGATLSAADL